MLPIRKSLRLKNYDYSKPASFFVTICVYKMENLFGKISNGKRKLNDFGLIVKRHWLNNPIIRPNTKNDEFIIMPNHFHGIITIKTCAEAYCNTPLHNTPLQFKSPSQTLGAIIRGFKGATTNDINLVRHTPGKRLWLRNYYDNIIRTEKSFTNFRQYIINNPVNFSLNTTFS
ncbi:MAG: transposase [bacterium]